MIFNKLKLNYSKLEYKKVKSSKLQSKKSEISIQFNWIFILIVGVIIITFFLSIVSKQKSQSEQKISVNVITSFKTILKSSSVNERALQKISMPTYDMEFYCDLDTCTEQGCNSGYTVDKSGLDVSSGHMAIFSPDILKGKNIFTYSLGWNLPYHVQNFLFVTTDQVRYVIANDSDTIKLNLFKEIMPDNLTYSFVHSDDLSTKIKDQNYYKVRYIFFNKDPNTISSNNFLNSVSNKINSTVIYLDFNGAYSGTTYYYQVSSGLNFKGSVNFFDNASMLASIFSENKDYYNCNMIKAFTRFLKLSSVYKNKLNEFQVRYSSGICTGVPYSSLSVNNLIDISKTIISQKRIDSSAIANLRTNINTIININKRARDNSCPVIY